MFDCVTLRLNDLPENYRLLDYVRNSSISDEHTFRCELKNLRICQNPRYLTIMGSLAKYLNDENITPLSREQVKQATEKLENELGLSLKNAIVCSLEFGTSIITDKKPFEYLKLFGYKNRLIRDVYSDETINYRVRRNCSKWKGIGTVNYFTPTGPSGFIGYDKIKEMKKQIIPHPFEGRNVLRLENKMRENRLIAAKYKTVLSAYALFSDSVFKKSKELFLEEYKKIDKMGRSVYDTKSKNITPKKFMKLLAELYHQSLPESYDDFIQRLIVDDKLSPKSLERIRAEHKKLANDIYLSDANPLIKELDNKVKMVMSGT
jgi:hypothetical protein